MMIIVVMLVMMIMMIIAIITINLYKRKILPSTMVCSHERDQETALDLATSSWRKPYHPMEWCES